MFFLWICPFISNVPHSFQPIVFKPYPKFCGSGAVYLGGIQERPYKVYTYLVGGRGGGWLILRWHYRSNYPIYGFPKSWGIPQGQKLAGFFFYGLHRQSFDKMDDDWGYLPFTEARRSNRRLGRPFEKKRGWLRKAHFLCWAGNFHLLCWEMLGGFQ